MAVVVDAITPVAITRAGTVEAALVALSGSSAGSGVKFPNNGRTFLAVKSTGGVSVATLTTQETVAGQSITSPTVSIADGVTKFIGPFELQLFDEPSGADQGDVVVTFDVPSQVTAKAYRLV